MDVDCDYLVYDHSLDDSVGEDDDYPCPHCSVGRQLDDAMCHESPRDARPYATPEIPFEEASRGRMVRCVVAYEEERTKASNVLLSEEPTTLYYVKENSIVELRGEIYLRDISPYGTWVSPTPVCLRSVERLKRAGLACMTLPELNRIVLEQKNDDGLLHLMRMWLRRAKNCNVGIEAFGPFFCDAALAPVLHVILRSEWIEQRKRRLCTNNELKPGWAQEFYDWTRVAVTSVGAPVFVHNPQCSAGTKCCGEGDLGRIASSVLNVMRRCGYTPWSAVNAVRRNESKLLQLQCPGCYSALMTYCAFLMEQAAFEASKQRDWLVRNEAVIQLCWVLWGIHSGYNGENQTPGAEFEWDHTADELSDDFYEDFSDEFYQPKDSFDRHNDRDLHRIIRDEDDDDDEEEEEEEEVKQELLNGWSESIVAHCVAFHMQECEEVRWDRVDTERLTVMYGVDHLPSIFRKVKRDNNVSRDVAPDSELIDAILLNGGFLQPKRTSSSALKNEDLSIPPAGETLIEVPERMEVMNQNPDIVAQTLVSYFPRVSRWALSHLTLKAPELSVLNSDSRTLWPVFVNPTRACYRLFKHLALPVAPNPAYALEMLARSWRRVPRRVLEGFLPTASGGTVEIDRSHYERYFVAPLNVLSETVSIITPEEKKLMLEVLSRGVLPCFAGYGESSVDRMVSSTLALSFAACGLRLLDAELAVPEPTGSTIFVSEAGLLYFAAWYVLVYTAALHTVPEALRTHLSHVGNDADKLLCDALRVVESKGRLATEDETDGYIDAKLSSGYAVRKYRDRNIIRALLIVFGGLIDERTVLRVAQLYVPELTAQLPFLKAAKSIPESVGSAIEGRDVWLETLEGNGGRCSRGVELPFVYIGDVAHELHSSVKGAVLKRHSRRTAEAPPRHDDRGFDPWYDCLVIVDPETRRDSYEFMTSDLAAAPAEEISDDPNENGCEYILQSFEKMTIQPNDDSRSYDHLDGHAGRLTDKRAATPNPGVQSAVRDRRYERVCGGLYVAELDALGFTEDTRKQFLREAKDGESLGIKPGGQQCFERRELRIPCLNNIAHTVYAKIQGTEIDGMDVVLAQPPHYQCNTLMKALWMLFVGASGGAERVSSQRAVDQVGNSDEPSTVEALAVMVHLAVKSFASLDVNELGVCNDIKTLYTGVCKEEKLFIPITAIAAGLFELNVQIYVGGCFYRIVNKHYGNKWPAGFLEYKEGTGWCLKNLPPGTFTSEPPLELNPDNRCYHQGTYRAYTRLNGLKVIRVKSDGNCGFHAIFTLLAGTVKTCDLKCKRELSEKTALFVFMNKERSDIATYLMDKRLSDTHNLVKHITGRGYWLDVQDVKYILEAHGKTLGLITENSYPIYDSTCSYILIKNNHYEPLLPI